MSDRTLIFIFLVTFFISNTINSQQQISFDYTKLIDVVNLCSKSSVFVQTPQGGGTGTLFTVLFSDTSNLGLTYVATAKHVLNKFDSTGKIIGRYDTVNVILNLKKGTKESRKYRWVLLSKDLDVAILEPLEYRRPFKEYDVFAQG